MSRVTITPDVDGKVNFVAQLPVDLLIHIGNMLPFQSLVALTDLSKEANRIYKLFPMTKKENVILAVEGLFDKLEKLSAEIPTLTADTVICDQYLDRQSRPVALKPEDKATHLSNTRTKIDEVKKCRSNLDYHINKIWEFLDHIKMVPELFTWKSDKTAYLLLTFMKLDDNLRELERKLGNVQRSLSKAILMDLNS